MPSLPTFGILGNPADAVPAPNADSPFRVAILGDFSGRACAQEDGSEKVTPDAILARKPCKITRENFDDIVTIMKVKVMLPDLQGEAFEHSFASLDDFHPDQIHEKADRFAFVSDEDDKATLMAALLHHPNFQAVESAWRGVDWFLRRAQKAGNKVEVVLYDITQDEFAAAAFRTGGASDDLAASPLYQLLIEQATQGPKGQPWTLWLGLYRFDLTGPDAQVLGRIAKIARHAAAPFLAGAQATILNPSVTLDEDATAAWTALRKLPEAAMLGLALPRFLLRLPYGENTQSTERFSFEEFTKFAGNQGYLWGNAALAAAGHPIYHVPSEDWTTAEQALNWIHEMVKKKIKKAKELADKDISYPNQTFLLLYININDFGTISEEINDKIPLVTESAKGWFSSGWVLWNDRAYQV